MTPIHALVFTKDRAMQLDAFLQTCGQYAPYETITILSASDDDSYRRCFSENGCDAVLYDQDGGFEAQVRAWLAEYERVVFHTDDEMFFAAPGAHLLALDNSEVILTHRQGRNTTYCHPLNCDQSVPATFPWRWRDAALDFAYPLSLNATIYNSKDIAPLIDFSFSNPTELEAQLAANMARLQVEWMTSPEHSCTVALPHNRTSVSSGCPFGENPEWYPDALRERYMDGWRIAPERMDFSRVNAAHVEIPLAFKIA
jgi:hypothetical protein